MLHLHYDKNKSKQKDSRTGHNCPICVKQTLQSILLLISIFLLLFEETMKRINMKIVRLMDKKLIRIEEDRDTALIWKQKFQDY